MKIKKFNESIPAFLTEKELIDQYNKKSTIYYIKFINNKNEDLYAAGYNSTNLDIIISKLVELKTDNPRLFYYILETTKNDRIIPEEELKVLIDSNKYNI